MLKINDYYTSESIEYILSLQDICESIERVGKTHKKSNNNQRYEQYLNDRKMYCKFASLQHARVEFHFQKGQYAYIVFILDNLILWDTRPYLREVFQYIMSHKIFFTVHNNRIALVVDYEINKQ